MAIQLQSVVVLAPNQVLLNFSIPLQVDGNSYETSNYAFITRIGFNVPLYTSSVGILPGNQSVVVTTVDAMLQGGYYRVIANGLYGNDGNPIDITANSQNFSGVGLPQWCFLIKQHAPSWWAKNYGSNFAAILEAVGKELDTLAGIDNGSSSYSTAQQALCLRTATGTDLSVIASNYGVTRPDFAVSDDIFRELIPYLATQRKCVLSIFYGVLTALLGPQETSGWVVYDVEVNSIVIEVPAGLLPEFGAATFATYLHEDQTVPSGSGSFSGYYLLEDPTHADSEIGGLPVVARVGVNDIEAVISQIKAAGIEFSIFIS
jgi:hypothetical protein